MFSLFGAVAAPWNSTQNVMLQSLRSGKSWLFKISYAKLQQPSLVPQHFHRSEIMWIGTMTLRDVHNKIPHARNYFVQDQPPFPYCFPMFCFITQTEDSALQGSTLLVGTSHDLWPSCLPWWLRKTWKHRTATSRNLKTSNCNSQNFQTFFRKGWKIAELLWTGS